MNRGLLTSQGYEGWVSWSFMHRRGRDRTVPLKSLTLSKTIPKLDEYCRSIKKHTSTEEQAVCDSPVRRINWLERKNKNIQQPPKALTRPHSQAKLLSTILLSYSHPLNTHQTNPLIYFQTCKIEIFNTISQSLRSRPWNTSTTLSLPLHLEPEPDDFWSVRNIIPLQSPRSYWDPMIQFYSRPQEKVESGVASGVK